MGKLQKLKKETTINTDNEWTYKVHRKWFEGSSNEIFQAYSTAMPVSPDIKDTDPLAVFIHRCNINSVISEEFSELIPQHGHLL